MSLLDRIKGTGPSRPEAEPVDRVTRPFDELSPGNAMEATARFGPGGDDTRGDTRNDTRSAGPDSMLSSIISEALPSEAAGDLAAARAGQQAAGGDVGSGLPVIGSWPIERQQRVLTIMLGLGLVALLLTSFMAVTAGTRGADQLKAEEAADDLPRPSFAGPRWRDGDDRIWQEIDLGALARHEQFLGISA